MLQQYAEAIYKAQADRDQKVLVVLADVMGIECTPDALRHQMHRIAKVKFPSAEEFKVDGVSVAFATFPTCSQGVNDHGNVTITASYEFKDLRT